MKKFASNVVEATLEPPPLLNKLQLAVRLNISVPTVDRLQLSGKIPRVKVGGKVMFEWEKVIEALRSVPQNDGN